MRKQTLQWHPAFYAGIQIEFSEESGKLIFENEHQLGTKPKAVDVLIIKKKPEETLSKNIGQIFRKYNIVEYKNPSDYLSIDDYYKVCAYACLYKADAPGIDTIKSEEITLTFVCSRYPRKLSAHLKRERKYRIICKESGIYYIIGGMFPTQLIITANLSGRNNFWLHNLTNRIQDKEIVEELFTEYEKHKDEKLYQSVMDIIVRANIDNTKEVNDMCEAMYEILKDRIDAEKEQFKKEGIQIGIQTGIQTGIQQGIQTGIKTGIQQGIQTGIKTGIQQGIQTGIQTGIQQGIKKGIRSLIEVCKSLNASREIIRNALIEKFAVTETEAEEYMQLYW